MNSSDGYLHGYDPEEQQRLYAQARFLEERVFESINFHPCRHILEVGCGVGAQSEILLRRFPSGKLTGIDVEPMQIRKALQHLNNFPELKGRFQLQVADVHSLSQNLTDPFDGAFLCWILEHVPDPLALLRKVRSLLVCGSIIAVVEVCNHTLFVEPTCPTLNRYWDAYNEHQQVLGGDPHVGCKLGSLLHQAGFYNIQTRPRPLIYDSRSPSKRESMLLYWKELLLSAAPELLKCGKVSSSDVDALHFDFESLMKNPEAIFYYAFMKATATA